MINTIIIPKYTPGIVFSLFVIRQYAGSDSTMSTKHPQKVGENKGIFYCTSTTFLFLSDTVKHETRH